MSRKAKVLIGFITVATFAGVGISMLLSERYAIGTVLVMLAALRLGYTVRQLREVLGSES